jgi:hypothetical protein
MGTATTTLFHIVFQHGTACKLACISLAIAIACPECLPYMSMHISAAHVVTDPGTSRVTGSQSTKITVHLNLPFAIVPQMACQAMT